MQTSTLNIVGQPVRSESEQGLVQINAVELTDNELDAVTGAWGGCGGSYNYGYGNFNYGGWGGWGGNFHRGFGRHRGFGHGHGGHGHGGHGHGGHGHGGHGHGHH